MPEALVAPAPFTSETGRAAAIKAAEAKRRKNARLEQLQTIADGLSARDYLDAIRVATRARSVSDTRRLIHATKKRIAHCYANPFPGYAREVRELAGALTEFRRQESILLARPRKRTGAQSNERSSRSHAAKPRSQPKPAAAPG